MIGRHRRPSLTKVALLAAVVLMAGLLSGSSSALGGSYNNVVFSDDFESGGLSLWDGLLGNGSATVASTSAHAGGFGLNVANASGQFQVLVKSLPTPYADTSVTFWARVAAGGGVETIAQTRDASTSQHMWDLAYDGTRRGLIFYPYRAAGSSEIFTGTDSVAPGAWFRVEVQYTATASGGAQLYVNGQTQTGWGVTGDYTRTANLQRLQLWNDGPNAVDFDDASLAVPAGAATTPGAPTGVAGTAGNGSVALSWIAPAATGGSAITGYRITPYIGGSAQPPRSSGSAATSFSVTGLTNGIAYTFVVAAVNAVGAGPDSAPSDPATPSAGPAAPGAPSGVVGASGNRSIDLSWNAPTSNGGSAITGYVVTRYVGTVAQTPIRTGSAATSYTVSGLTNGTAYTFTVAAENAIGTGPASPASAPVTPGLGYGNVVFADGFESGSLAAWSGTIGDRTPTAVAAAARGGSYGLRMLGTGGQYAVVVKALPSPLTDSSVSFWVRPATGTGIETIAQARDGSSSAHMWDLYYDASRQRLILDTYKNVGSDEVATGANVAPANTWTKIEVRYTATSTGGASLVVNGATKPGWSVTGNYARTANLQRLQMWNDGSTAVDFDDARIAVPVPAGAVLPGTPTTVSAKPRDAAVDLSWTAPASDGGTSINGYVITPRIGATAQSPITVDYPVTSYGVKGLVNGTAYTFTVAALNGIGTGSASAASAAVTPAKAAVPGAPTGVTAAASDASASITWVAPTTDGGTGITSYVVTPYVGGVARPSAVTSPTQTSYTFPGLVNGTAYTFTVAAVNSVGTSAQSTPSAAVTPRPALAPYTNVVFADGFESGDLSHWNGSQGTGTTAVVAAAARTGGYGARLATLETQYAYLVAVLPNPVQDSLSSFWVRLGTDSKVVTVAQARDGTSSVNMWQVSYDGIRDGFLFHPYSSAGSTEIFTGTNSVIPGTWIKVDVQYTATATGGAQIFLNGTTQSSWGVAGNYARTADLQRVQLWNEGMIKNDFDDVSVATVAPSGITVPTAPTAVLGAPLDRAAQLNWTAPASVGGSAITGYQVTPYVGTTAQPSQLTGTAATTFTFAGLTNGTTYTFRVAAMNAAGSGPDSGLSGPVTPQPAPPPGSPTAVTARALDGSAGISWTAPSSDGGSPIIGYQIRPFVGGVAQTPINTGSAGTTFTATGLSNGTSYTFTVAATNSSGTGGQSSPSNAVTPQAATVPGAPADVTGSARDSAVALTWTAPTSDGGSPITSYQITPYRGATAQTPINTGSSATGFTVAGLTNGTSYTFTVAAHNLIGTGAASSASSAVTPAVQPANPIQLENKQMGTTSYQFTVDRKASSHEIEGYTSVAGVNKGGTIGFMVSLSAAAQYNMDIYRMGWYPQGTNPDGSSCAPSCGGRLMTHVGPLNGVRQTNCSQDLIQNDTDFGLTECQWTAGYTLSVPTSWTTGQYIVKLTRLDNRLENYMTFTVRDDSSTAPVVYSMDVSTWQAYNQWGGAGNSNVGYSLYGRFNDVTGDVAGSGRAFTVSMDRPYGGGFTDGAGLFFNWDFPMLRFMESKGYDISYVTSVDLDSRPGLLNGHKVFVNTGHDEYYSDGMRSQLQNGIGSGVNMAFFSANNFYYRITWGSNASGGTNRRIHSDKNALPGSTTFEWRLLSPPHPENEIGGVLLTGVANDRNFLVSNANSWIYAGTGLKTYVGNGTTGVVTSGSSQNALPGILGYEIDGRASTSPGLSAYTAYEPPNELTVGHSFVPTSDGNATSVWSDATLYTSPSGATVFSAGTIQWSWGVDAGYNDGFCSCSPGTYANSATQMVTQNILDRFTS